MSSALRALLVATVAVLGAAAGALAVDRLGLGPGQLVPAVAVLVVATLFWFRPVEGLLAFGLFTLLADTIEHWLRIDVLLFDELGLLALLAVAVGARHVVWARLRLGLLEGSVLVLALAGIVSSLVNGVPVQTWTAGLFLLLKGIAFFGLVRLLPLRVPDVERLGVAMLVVASVIGALGVIEWLDPGAFQSAMGLPLYDPARGDVPTIKSIFLHPAQFGWLTAVGSLICFARFITHRSWWALPGALSMSAGTFLSGRRTPLIGVAAAVLLGLAEWSTRIGLRRAVTRVWLPVASVALVATVLTAPALMRLVDATAHEYGPSIDVTSEVFAEEPRSDIIAPVHPRIALYAGSLAIARDEFPLGGGIGRFGSHLSREEYSPLYKQYGLDQVRSLEEVNPQAATDAFWPMVLGETGVIGLLSAMAFFGGMAVVLWVAASAAAHARLRTILLAALFIVTEGLIRSATSSVYVAPPIGYFVLGTAAAALAASATERETSPAQS